MDDNELVERVRDAIFNAENGIDGDQIGDMLHEDFRIPSENSIEATKMVCERAARAAIAVMRDAGWGPKIPIRVVERPKPDFSDAT